MSNIYFMCENCGIETNGITFVNGMKFCAKCYHQIFGKDNQQTEITQLKQQLAEKDCRIEELEGQFAYECECNRQLVELQKQLEEKQKTIDEINKEFVQSVKDWKTLCAEKDKEIEELKLKLDIRAMSLQNINTERMESEQNQTQLAIQELEKVKTLIQNAINFEKPNFVGVYDAINKQIKELKGEKDDG